MLNSLHKVKITSRLYIVFSVESYDKPYTLYVMNSMSYRAIHILLLAAFFFSSATRLSLALSRITNTPASVQSFASHSKKPTHRPVIAAYEAKHHSTQNERDQRDHSFITSEPTLSIIVSPTGNIHTLSESLSRFNPSTRRLSRGPPLS